jgi:hypothetical protein
MAARESLPFLPQASVCQGLGTCQYKYPNISLQQEMVTYLAFAAKLDNRWAAHDGCGAMTFPEPIALSTH